MVLVCMHARCEARFILWKEESSVALSKICIRHGIFDKY